MALQCLEEMSLLGRDEIDSTDVGRLVVLTRGSYSHEEIPYVTSSQGLPHEFKVALLYYMDTDLLVPEIMCPLEPDGYVFGCTIKK